MAILPGDGWGLPFGRRATASGGIDINGIEVVEGDITTQSVDAIVNAANESLLGGGGVDGAIHRAAGPGLKEECRRLGGCPTGEARITGGYDLPAAHVIHTVGPIWRGGDAGEAALLTACYRNSLDLARRHHIRSIAFPAISTGAFGYPLAEATAIAVATVGSFIATTPLLARFVCFDARTARAYREELAAQTG